MKELFEKPVNELTVSDSFKIQAVVLAAMAGAGVLMIGAGHAYDRIKRRRNARTAHNAALLAE